MAELQAGRERGYDVPNPSDYGWLKLLKPRSIPSEWLVLDLGAGELETMAMALERPDLVVLLDDALARRIAHAAGLEVWGRATSPHAKPVLSAVEGPSRTIPRGRSGVAAALLPDHWVSQKAISTTTNGG